MVMITAMFVGRWRSLLGDLRGASSDERIFAANGGRRSVRCRSRRWLLLCVGEHLLLQLLRCSRNRIALVDHSISSLFQASVSGIGVTLANASHEGVRDWISRRHAVRWLKAARFVRDH